MKLRAHQIAIRIAHEMFKHIDEYIKTKDYYAKYIIEKISNIEGLKANKVVEGGQNSWYALIIHYDSSMFNNTSVHEFIKALNAEGGGEFDFPSSTCPLDNLELFQNPDKLFSKYDAMITEEYKNANKFFNNIIKLPVWYRQEDFEIIVKYVEVLEKVATYYKNNKPEGGR